MYFATCQHIIADVIAMCASVRQSNKAYAGERALRGPHRSVMTVAAELGEQVQNYARSAKLDALTRSNEARRTKS